MGNLRKIKKALRHQHPGPARPQADGGVETMDLDRQELEAILEHAKMALSEEEYTKLHAAMETLIFLTTELEKKRVSVQRLKQLLFGTTTETTRKVMKKILNEAGKEGTSRDEAAEGQEPEARPKAKGHGRNGAEAYGGAEQVRVPHASLRPGDPCPTVKRARSMRASNRAVWCGCMAKPLWEPPSTSYRSCGATCAARSSRPKRRRRWEKTNMMRSRPA